MQGVDDIGSPAVSAFVKEHVENLVAEFQSGASDPSSLIHFLPGAKAGFHLVAHVLIASGEHTGGG